MTTGDSAPAIRPERDILTITPGELRDTIRLTIDRELVDELDRRRGTISRSEYAEMVLAAALQREHPHLPTTGRPNAPPISASHASSATCRPAANAAEGGTRP